MIKRRGGGEGGKAVSRGEGTEGMRVESPSEETRGKVEGRDKRDLRAKVLELLVDALQSHCDEGMWYLKRGRDDLGSWLAESGRQYFASGQVGSRCGGGARLTVTTRRIQGDAYEDDGDDARRPSASPED
jgi:hypothetical protein